MNHLLQNRLMRYQTATGQRSTGDVVARGLRIRADLVRGLDQRLHLARCRRPGSPP